MALVPVVPTKAVGDLVLAADWNDYVKGTRDFLVANKPLVHLVQTATQSGWTSATMTAVTFTAEELDRDGQHSTTVNTSRVTIGGTLGWWRVHGIYAAPGNVNTVLTRCRIALNGTGLAASQCNAQWSSFSGTAAIQTGVVYVEATAAGDYVELQGFQQATAGTIGTGIAVDIASTLTLEYLGL